MILKHIQNSESLVSLTTAENTDKPIVVVADDTDILVLLCYHSKMSMSNLYLRPEPRYGMKKQKKRCWDIRAVKSTLGQQVCDRLPFVHAILGCDTTSHIHGFGKGAALKLICTSEDFQEQADVFGNPKSTKADVKRAGGNAIICIYKGRSGDKLDLLRLQRFQQKVGCSRTCVKPEVLPPTSAAAVYHSFRVYF